MKKISYERPPMSRQTIEAYLRLYLENLWKKNSGHKGLTGASSCDKTVLRTPPADIPSKETGVQPRCSSLLPFEASVWQGHPFRSK